jgi:hypothetical protein
LATFNVYLKQKQAIIIGVALVSYLLIAYIIALDFAALLYRNNPPSSIIKNIHFNNGTGDPFTLLYEIPTIVIVLDWIFGVFLCFCCLILVAVISALLGCHDNLKKIKCWDEDCCNPFFPLCLSTLGFLFCIVTHLPFIAIAYLNDAYHAGSIFVYYTIITLILFAVVEQMIVSCLSKLKPFKKVIQLQESVWEFNSGELHVESGKDVLVLPLLEGECNVIKVSEGKVELRNKRVESGIDLVIASGTLKFRDTVSKPAPQSISQFLTGLSQQQEQKLTLAVQKPLPKAYVTLRDDETVHIFSGLIPANDQALKVCHVDCTQGDVFTLTLSETELSLLQTGKFHETCNNCCCKRCGYYANDAWIGGTTVAIAVLILFMIGIVAVLTGYFVIIPINRSISDAPNRLIGIYESAIVLVGAYIAYKAFFKAKKYLENSIINRENPLTQESKDKWKDMSDEEKLAEFYSAVVDIIVDKKSRCQQQDTPQPNTNTVSVSGQPQGTQPRDVHIRKRSNTWPAVGTAPGGQPETGSTTSTTADGKPYTDSVYTQPATATCEKAPGIPPANVTGEAEVCTHQGEGQPGTGLTTSTAAGARGKHTEYSQPATAIGEAGKGQPAAATEGGQRDITQPGTAEQDESRAVNATQENREDTPPLSSNGVAERIPLLKT